MAGAKTIVIEHPYVDRHYLEEYTAYYATVLRAHERHTTRLHIFSDEFSDRDLESWIKDAATSGAQSLQKKFSSTYLGYVTIRPIPSSPIGRTLLRPYGNVAARSYPPARTQHKVHLLGLDLTVSALPFQQQEQGVGACATTALWSVLSRVIRADGGRAPTPFAVTMAATRHYLADRVTPAVGGLELAQMTAAVREFGYSPYVTKPRGDLDTFALFLKCYIHSGIPVVLLVDDGSIANFHAIAAVGIRESDEELRADDIVVRSGSQQLVSRGVSRVYIHDDRFGPYIRMNLSGVSPGDPAEVLAVEGGRRDDRPLLRRKPDEHDRDGIPEFDARVSYALVPLYPKLRLTARELIDIAWKVEPTFRILMGPELRGGVRYDFRFMLSGEYLNQIYGKGISATRVHQLVTQLGLSRYVGIVRVTLLDRGTLADVVCDTTDIIREDPTQSCVLAVIAFDDKHVDPVEKLLGATFPFALFT